MDNTLFKFSLEQELQIRIVENEVKNLSEKEVKEYLVYLYKHMIYKENMYKSILLGNLYE